MKLIRLLLLPIFVIPAAFVGVAQDDTRAVATWQVQKYDIVANLPAADTDRSLTAKATLTVKNVSSAPASTLSLRISPNAEITTVTINGASADFTKREETVGANGSVQ